jgi:hypothetical protein
LFLLQGEGVRKKVYREKIKSFVIRMISGLQRIDLFYWIISLNLKPCPLSLFPRNKFIFSGMTLFAMERVYLMFTQKAGLRGKEEGVKVALRKISLLLVNLIRRNSYFLRNKQ